MSKVRKGTSDKVRATQPHRDRTKYERTDYKTPISGEDYCPHCAVLLVYADERAVGVCQECYEDY